jgi:ribosomal protein S18 acetylase RimI-like enzyme
MRHRSNAEHVSLRSVVSADRETLERLVARIYATSRFAEVATYALRMALEGEANESQAIVAERAGAVVGLGLFGEVAGTIGTARIHFMAVALDERSRGIGSAICEAALARLEDQGARNVVAELPDEAAFVSGRALLERWGFAPVARVADYYSDGVDMLIFERVAAGT